MRISKFQLVLITGAIVRLVIAPFFAHPFDVYSWYLNGESLLNGSRAVGSFLVPYSYSLFLFVFPATAAFQSLSSIIGNTVIPMSSLSPVLNPGAPWNITVVPGMLFNLLVKLPLILSDTIVAVLLYKIVLKHNGDDKLAIAAMMLWYLNPLTIWVSSGWGMFDTLPALFTVLSLWLAFDERFLYSGISVAIAVAMKYYAIVLVVPLLIISWRAKRWRGLLASSGGAVGGGLLLFSPLLWETASGFASLVSGASPQALHYSGLSIWTAITLFYPSFDQTVLSSALVIVALLAAYVWMARKKLEPRLETYAALFGLPILAVLLFFRFVGENYFVWLLPFASVLAISDSRSRLLYWGISLIALISSVVDSLLPYYMLPMAPWIGNYLVGALSAVASYRVAPSGVIAQGVTAGKIALSLLGVSMAAFLTSIGVMWSNLRSATLGLSAPQSVPSLQRSFDSKGWGHVDHTFQRLGFVAGSSRTREVRDGLDLP